MKLRKITKLKIFIEKELEKLVTIIISPCDIALNIGKNLGDYSPLHFDKKEKGQNEHRKGKQKRPVELIFF